MRISKEYLDQLCRHSANDLVSVMQESGVELEKQGKEWKGRCPFHEDGTPSLSVNREKGVYKCFGCGASGNVLGYVKQRGISSNPVSWLEDRAGMTASRPPSGSESPLSTTTALRLAHSYSTGRCCAGLGWL